MLWWSFLPCLPLELTVVQSAKKTRIQNPHNTAFIRYCWSTTSMILKKRMHIDCHLFIYQKMIYVFVFISMLDLNKLMSTQVSWNNKVYLLFFFKENNRSYLLKLEGRCLTELEKALQWVKMFFKMRQYFINFNTYKRNFFQNQRVKKWKSEAKDFKKKLCRK